MSEQLWNVEECVRLYNDCAIMLLHLIHICRAYISLANKNHSDQRILQSFGYDYPSN